MISGVNMRTAFACATCLTFGVGCGVSDDLDRGVVEGWEPVQALKDAMAKDIASRSNWDDYRRGTEAENVARIEHECSFTGVHLKADETVQVIVTLGARSTGDNASRGVHGYGPFYIYDVRGTRPLFLGEILGDDWWVDTRTTNGFADITCNENMGSQEFRIDRYKFRRGQYRKDSTIMRSAGH